MFTFEYPVSELPEFLEALAIRMGAKFTNNFIDIPSKIGDGYIQLLNLPNDLQAFIMNFKLNTDFSYQQSQAGNDLYTLRFEDSHVADSFVTRIDGESLEDNRVNHASVYLASSIFDLQYLAHKGTAMRCITVQLHRDWLARYFKMEIIDDVLNDYLSLKTSSLNLEPLDIEYKKKMVEIIEIDRAHPTYTVALQNRVMAIVERFFNNLYEKRSQLQYHVRASSEDIEKIRNIERIITQNLTDSAPSLKELSKIALMSPTKLKALFKDMYGKPIYRYYQDHRLQKAKEMLMLKIYTVNDIALSLGFSNAGNFIYAFKKAFNKSPGTYLNQ